MLSEATSLAGDLLSQFPSIRGDISDGFIGALTSVLMQYPRQVAIKCSDPRRGLARETKFLSIAEVVAWCEKDTEPMRRDIAREDRIAAQIAACEEWQNEEKPPSLLAKTQAWLDRSDPIAKRIAGSDDDPAVKERKATLSAQIEQANKRVFERECKQTGIDPTRGVSPALLKTLGGTL